VEIKRLRGEVLDLEEGKAVGLLVFAGVQDEVGVGREVLGGDVSGRREEGGGRGRRGGGRGRGREIKRLGGEVLDLEEGKTISLLVFAGVQDEVGVGREVLRGDVSGKREEGGEGDKS
jgi:hypothetical protein